VDPGRYGHEPVTDAFPPEPLRDDHEFTVLDAALANDLPVAGICRGLQLMNVHAGGTLNQDVPSHSGFAQPATTEWHGVAFEADSVLAGIYGENRQVNSLHHQTVDRLGDGLRISARSDDGSVEGIEYTARPLVAVQWHPEMLSTRAEDPLFAWLVSVASSQSLLR
jgi:putative glutamine amidotransferase